MILLSFMGVFIYSCEDMNETQAEFVDRGETKYVGKAMELFSNVGFKKVKLNMVISNDPLIKKGTITYYAPDEEVLEFDVVRNKNGIDTISQILELQQGSYNLTVQFSDGNGHYSLKNDHSCFVYGDAYIQSLANRDIVDMVNDEDGLSLSLSSANSGLVNSKITYQTNSDLLIDTIFTSDVESLLLEDVKKGSSLKIVSYYLFDERQLEIFETSEETYTVPLDYLIPKSEWSGLLLADDTPDAYGWVLSNLWDESTDTGFHSPDPTTYPALISFDLGNPTLIKSISMAPRPDFNDRFPDDIEIWMSNTSNELGVSAVDAEWETKANEAGWVKVDATSLSPNTAANIDGNEFYRYMRVRVLSVPAGGTTPINMMEISLIGQVQ